MASISHVRLSLMRMCRSPSSPSSSPLSSLPSLIMPAVRSFSLRPSAVLTAVSSSSSSPAVFTATTAVLRRSVVPSLSRRLLRLQRAAFSSSSSSSSSSSFSSSSSPLFVSVLNRTVTFSSFSSSSSSSSSSLLLAGRRLLAQQAANSTMKKKKNDMSSLTNFIAFATLGVLVITTAFGIYTLGAPEPMPPVAEGQEQPPPPDMSLGAWVSRAWKQAHQIYQDTFDPHPEPLLPEILPYPYRGSDYTLVLDLEDTLLHSEWTREHGWRTVKRPGVDEFLVMCYQLGYEIVLFSEKEVMDSAIFMEKLDINRVVTYRLFRGHMRYSNGELIKDLSLLNRDESKLILVDDNPKSFGKHPSNGLRIKKFTGDIKDNSLPKLLELLHSLRRAEVEDVRDIIKTYSDVEDAGEEFVRRRQQIIEQQQMLLQQQQQQQAQEAQNAAEKRKGRGWFGW